MAPTLKIIECLSAERPEWRGAPLVVEGDASAKRSLTAESKQLMWEEGVPSGGQCRSPTHGADRSRILRSPQHPGRSACRSAHARKRRCAAVVLGPSK